MSYTKCWLAYAPMGGCHRERLTLACMEAGEVLEAARDELRRGLEGLYGESIKMPGLADYLAERRVVACGPTTLGALLTTLQLGYKTAAIQKRSGELWALLSAFRREFKNFALILDKAQKKMQEAQDTIESAARKTRTIGRKLRAVEGDALPAGEEAKAGIGTGEEPLSAEEPPAEGEED